jgi:hypothetical protein
VSFSLIFLFFFSSDSTQEDNGFEIEGIKAIAEALKVNSSLMHLELAGIPSSFFS